MQRSQWFIFNKKQILGAVGLLIFLGSLAAAGFMFMFKQHPQLSGEELWSTALDRTRACKTYRYQVEVLYNGKTNMRGEGERVFPDRVHLTGSMANTKLEFIQIGEKGFMKDPYTKQWIKLEGNQLSQSELFITELNPLGMFNFKDIPQIKNLGKVKDKEQEYVELLLQPNLANPFMENFINFEYHIRISPDDYLIKQADISALSKGHEQVKFNLRLKFSDYDKDITINPPL
jgi:hypothetical protein